MFRWKENQKLKSFYLESDSFLPPLEKGDTKAFNEGQKGHCFIAKEVQARGGGPPYETDGDARRNFEFNP